MTTSTKSVQEVVSAEDCGLIIDALRLYARSYGCRRSRMLADAINYTGNVCRICGTDIKRDGSTGAEAHCCWR